MDSHRMVLLKWSVMELQAGFPREPGLLFLFFFVSPAMATVSSRMVEQRFADLVPMAYH